MPFPFFRKPLPKPADVANRITAQCRGFAPDAERFVISWDDFRAIAEGAATNGQDKGVAANYWRDLVGRLERT